MNWYAFLMGAGASLGLWRVAHGVTERHSLRWTTAGLLVLFSAMLFARLGYFVVYPAYFQAQGMQALAPSAGGYVWPGALLGGWLAIGLISWLRRIPFLHTTDRLLPLLPPMAVMAWLACWPGGCAYGPEMLGGWWAPLALDESGAVLHRMPLQWLAALSLLVLYFGLENHFPERRPGQPAALTWLVFSVHTFLFSWLRADLRSEWMGLTWDLWAALVCVLLALVFCLVTFWPTHTVEKLA
ncbi:MAG: hypothetical protein CVU39_12815 [Chloroflexi bacterium HGW-Chloroflexi-10]|nr:MAG: hypothetical protein CVU39_12815 [Chloroflexi bacterium HGW-Chloroflexi-10]